ncbi:hypothetical protein [Burkholderia sp. Ac-20349]|uniref:hypothetical protein n=1 Tax=Burkholderia sp. Ac-20349 TaxID=2703893 RepID=UPI00197B4AD3|nr:hypothetical protein [Burkholderia sp. Ac-20349]MBN3839349.1 hypothetical protein [Burkholderia sp. Ac-20349]
MAQLVAAYATRGVGHTTCALRGMGERVESATIRPLLVVGTHYQGMHLAPSIGRGNFVSLGSIESGKLRGVRRPLVWDNHAIEMVICGTERELARMDRECEERKAYGQELRRQLSVAESEMDWVKRSLRESQNANARLREQLADASAELEMAHASSPRY